MWGNHEKPESPARAAGRPRGKRRSANAFPVEGGWRQESWDADRLFAELDEKILKGMEDFSIPGCAVSVVYRGREHVRGFGVATIGQPAPVDAETVFRLASNSKTYTGAAAMRLVESGRLEFDRPVRSYVKDFEAPGAEDVTVRQVLNHSAGWLGYDYHGTGSDSRALARYVEDIRKLPQLTPLGMTFSYNNAALSVAGRVVEVVTGGSYEIVDSKSSVRTAGISAQPVLGGRARYRQCRDAARL